MIDWIKFKGSTGKEREKELDVTFPFAMLDSYKQIHAINYPAELKEISLVNFTAWAPLNLPQEEKWERKENFHDTMNDGKLLSHLNQEFDNIYSILNEMRKR
jgi:hypothetical protein